MNKLDELHDFSMYDGNTPCILCKGDSTKTLLGNHWKCSVCAHVFNQDGSEIGVDCYCEACQKVKHEAEMKHDKLVEKAIHKLQKIAKKISKKTKKTK